MPLPRAFVTKSDSVPPNPDQPRSEATGLGIRLQSLADHQPQQHSHMVSSEHGQKVIERVLRSQVLVETDGPYVRIGGRPALPTDIDIVYRYLARSWAQPVTKVVDQVFNNFMALLAR